MLEIRGVRVWGTHGVLDFERIEPQPFEFDLNVVFDMALAGASDALEDTVDYAAIIDAAADIVLGPWCALLERLARLMADAVLAVDGRIRGVEVGLRKLKPPVPYEIASAGVRITVSR
ncbi:MAG TPA: dihydroneopterin aldolase [Acidimicrobiales bacterium]|nr:dihydroneopterin aldolase [Acidimicrobiales bacterium]